MFTFLVPQEVQIDKQLQPGLRVTVRLSKTQNPGTFLHQTLKVFKKFFFSTSVKFGSIYLWNCLQKAKHIKVLSWLLTCPGLKVVIIGATVFVWHLVSVGFPFNSQHCALHSFAVCVNDYCQPLLYPHSCIFPVPAGAVFTESPFKGGYDLTIGTSERGSNADQASLTPFK